MERTLPRICVRALIQERQILQLVTKQGSRYVEFLATNNHDMLTSQEFLGYDRGQTAQKVTLRINHNELGAIRIGYAEW
jgi:hypothetical protein